MRAGATILHADADAFFASVEQRDDPSLRGRPVIVGHGVVMAASYEARARGVRGAMGGRIARRLCPDAVFVDPRFAAYTDASRAIFGIFEDTAPVVEGISLEEAFLDVRGLEHVSGRPLAIAARLRARIRDEVGLPMTVGIARTKALAKLASRTAKPDGLLLVSPRAEAGFLHPQPIERVWGIGPSSAARLHERGIHRVGQAARLGERELVAILGPGMGRQVAALVHNRDRRRVRHGRGRRSIGSQSALGRGHVRSSEELDAILLAVVDRVTRRMRRGGRSGRTVILRLRFGDYTRATRSATLRQPTAATATVLALARGLLREAMPSVQRRGVTMIGLTITNLAGGREGLQLPLPLPPRGEAVDEAMDHIRDRFGNGAVRRAGTLGRDSRNSPWSLPSDDAPPPA